MKSSVLKFIVCLFIIVNQTIFSSVNADLIDAAREHDKERVVQLLALGADVNASDKEGMTPLLHAVSDTDVKELANIFRQSFGNNDPKDNVPYAPVSEFFKLIDSDNNKHTVQVGDSDVTLDFKVPAGNGLYIGQPITLKRKSNNCFELAKILIEAGADVNARDENEKTVLIHAVMNYQTDVVDLLIKSNADINAQCEEGFTALMRACMRGIPEIARVLIDAGAILDTKARMSDERLESMFDAMYAAFPKEWNALMIACAFLDNTEIVTMLLDKTDYQNNGIECVNAFYIACANGHDHIVELFIERIIDPARSPKPMAEALNIAVYKGRERVVNILLSSNESLSKSANIYFAISPGNEKILERLIDAGIDVTGLSGNREDPNFCILEGASTCTPLLTAVEGNLFTMVKQLINAGADVNEKNNRSVTPLSLARKMGHKKIVKLLLEHGAKEPTLFDTIKGPALGIGAAVVSGIALKKLYALIMQCHKNIKTWREQREREERKQRRNKKIRPEDGMPGPHGVIGSHGSVVSEVTLQSERELDERRSREAEADRARREAATKALDDKRKKQAEENKAWLTLIDRINDAKEADKRQEAGRLARQLHEKIKSATSLSKSLKLKIMGRVRDLFSKEIISEATKIEIENRLEVIEIIDDSFL